LHKHIRNQTTQGFHYHEKKLIIDVLIKMVLFILYIAFEITKPPMEIEKIERFSIMEWTIMIFVKDNVNMQMGCQWA
jgi:hypothetical protein